MRALLARRVQTAPDASADLQIDFESLLVLNNDDEALEKLYAEFEFKPLKNSPVKKTAEEVAEVNSL